MNYEIELKAHVYNRAQVIENLNKIGNYGGHTEKKDTYYSFSLPAAESKNGKKHISARIRKEIQTLNGKTSETSVFTYKRKETKKTHDGNEIEVNQENEFSFENEQALAVFFMDLGAEISLTKEKSVEQWMVNINGENAHAELCTVPPLGDFLEIEIIKDNNDENTVSKCQDSIKKIFEKCNIPLENIEERYYRDMLKDCK